MHTTKSPAFQRGAIDRETKRNAINLSPPRKSVKGLCSLRYHGLYRSTDATPRCAVEIAPIEGGCHASS